MTMSVPKAVQDLLKRFEANRDKRRRARWEEVAPEDSIASGSGRTMIDKDHTERGGADQIEPTKRNVSDYTLVTDGTILEKTLQPLQGCKALALGIKTTGQDPFIYKIRLVQLYAAGNPVVVVDFLSLSEQQLKPIKRLLQIPCKKVFHYAKFALKFLLRAGLAVEGPLLDTMLMAKLLHAGLRDKGDEISDLAVEYLSEDLPADKAFSWKGHLTADHLDYSARETQTLARLCEVLVTKVKEAQLEKTARLEFGCIRAVVEMELNGMLLDLSRWDAISRKLKTEKDNAETALKKYLGNDINLDSPDQVRGALKGLGIEVEDTKEATLAPLAGIHPVVEVVIAYRKASKAFQAFANNLPRHVHPVTGRIHADYLQIGTVTGRFSCRNPNLQQIPRDKAFRSCFIAPPGHKLVIGDYSQIELRVAAEIATETRMIEAFSQSQDLHRLTASVVSGRSLGEVTESERNAAKALNFGVLYGMGPEGLRKYARQSYGVDMTINKARNYLERFFLAYPALMKWRKALLQNSPLEVRTLRGRRRLWPSKPPATELLNTPVQGTAADITKKALAMLPEALNGTGAKIVGTVHDEIIFEAPQERARQAALILKETMKNAGREYLRQVPIEVDVSIADSWADKG
jgi:DNA polymerase-1